MKLDRTGGAGKYAVINLRKLKEAAMRSRGHDSALTNAIGTLNDMGLLNYGQPGTPDEHFVIMLKDRHAKAALDAYADSAFAGLDHEYATDVRELADRAGPHSPFCKDPD